MAILHIVSVVAAIAVIVAAVFIYLYLNSQSELNQLRVDPSTELGSANIKLKDLEVKLKDLDVKLKDLEVKLKDSEANLSASNLLLDVNIITKVMDDLRGSEPELVELKKKLLDILRRIGLSDEAKNMMRTIKVEDLQSVRSYMVMRGEKRTSLGLSEIEKKYNLVFLR